LRQLLISVALAILVPFAAHAAVLTAGDAVHHVGQRATVCGVVASAHYAGRARGQPTFLDLGHAYPRADLAAVVWGEDRAKFGELTDLAGQRVCVSGTIALYRGTPEMVLRQASQLTR